jgi:hypothetical protein
MMGIVIAIFSVVAIDFFSDRDPYHFGSFSRSFFTMFQAPGPRPPRPTRSHPPQPPARPPSYPPTQTHSLPHPRLPVATPSHTHTLTQSTGLIEPPSHPPPTDWVLAYTHHAAFQVCTGDAWASDIARWEIDRGILDEEKEECSACFDAIVKETNCR